jgi:hypothetical protein
MKPLLRGGGFLVRGEASPEAVASTGSRQTRPDRAPGGGCRRSPVNGAAAQAAASSRTPFGWSPSVLEHEGERRGRQRVHPASAAMGNWGRPGACTAFTGGAPDVRRAGSSLTRLAQTTLPSDD